MLAPAQVLQKSVYPSPDAENDIKPTENMTRATFMAHMCCV